MGAPPTVDVFVLAYNQERFIAEALDGVLMQGNGVGFRLTIIEDFSTDSTRSIVQRYAARHPDRIQLRLNERNMWGSRPLMDALAQSRAKYVALLDGDDYW